MSPQKHVYIAIVIFCFVIVMGTTGYVLLYPGEGILKALYMTIITIATVGYEEVFEITKNPAAEVFTIILIIAGILALGFAIQTLARVAVEGEFQQIIGRKRMEKNVSKLKDHYIVSVVKVPSGRMTIAQYDSAGL